MTKAMKFSDERAYKSSVSLAESTENVFHRLDDCSRTRTVRKISTEMPNIQGDTRLRLGFFSGCTSLSLT